MIKQRNFGLDLARTMAITLVFSNHLITNILKIDIGPFWYLAYLGVDIFFGLSGFLIGGILIRLCDDLNGMLSPRDTLNFLMRRWFRTAPLYFLLLGVNFCTYNFLLEQTTSFDWHFLLWLQNFQHYPPHFFGESWSLCIEEWFYFTYSTLLCLFMLFTKRWRMKSIDKILLFTIAYILFFTIVRFICCDFNYSEIKIVIFRLDSIAYGVLMAALNQKRKLDNYKKAVGITGSLLLLIGVLFFLKAPFPFFSVFYYNLAGLGIALCVWYVQKSPFPKHLFPRLIVFISKISYSIYLVNLIVVYLLLYFFGRVINNYFLMLPGFALVLSLSYLTYRFVELPFLHVRNKYFPEKGEEKNGFCKSRKRRYSITRMAST